MQRPKSVSRAVATATFVAFAAYAAVAVAQAAFDKAKAIALTDQISTQLGQVRDQLTSPPDALATDLRELEGHSTHLRHGLEEGNAEITTVGVVKRMVDLALGVNEQAKAAGVSAPVQKELASVQANMLALEAVYGVDVATPPPQPTRPPAPPVAKADPCKEKVRLTGVEFAFDSDALTPASDDTLKLAADKLKKCDNIAVKIDGYTDSTGPARFNLELSQKRADAVKAYLVSNGIAAARLTTKGYGQADPIASNATKAGRADNRRVELSPAS